jgi:phage terminase small subunit
MEINQKQLAFIDEYFINGFNARHAYLTVYGKDRAILIETADRSASRLMDKPYVKEEIDKRRAKLTLKHEINRDNIVVELKDLIDECKTLKDRKALLGALDMLNKMAGNYIEKREIKIEGPIKLSFGGNFTPGQDETE